MDVFITLSVFCFQFSELPSEDPNLPGCVSEANRNTYYLTDRGRISVARDKQISQNILLNLESAVFQILQKSMARIALSRVLSLCEQSK